MIETERIPLWNNVDKSISIMRWKRSGNVDRPAMLVVPGGGYSCVCNATEGIPIAERFAGLGFQVFVLNYRVAPARYPLPQQDILRAIKLIRANAAAWHVIKNNLAVVGFSAGAHLCACSATICDEIDANAGDKADAESARPDAMLLAYPVITFIGKGHFGSGKNLAGDKYEELKAQLSLETRVTDKTPPAFIWHTLEDTVVPVENSLVFTEALHARNIPCELHLFPHGDHGLQLGYGRRDIAGWPEQAVTFLRESCAFKMVPDAALDKAVVLTFDDACINHNRDTLIPLGKHGFGATFFFTRFTDEWRTKHPGMLMTENDAEYLHRRGFEIGNHTWHHPDMSKLTEEQAETEIQKLTQFLLDAGLPAPVSFAYPGGPVAENIFPVLNRHAFRLARTIANEAWDIYGCDPYRVPAVAVHGNSMTPFLDALKLVQPYKPVVLVYHGIPDVVHPWVDTPFALFAEEMDYLADNGYAVFSMKGALEAAALP